MNHLMAFTLVLAVVATAETDDYTARQVGRTTVITHSDGSRTYCRPVGPNMVCTKEKNK